MSHAESWESELRAEWIAGVKFQKKTWSWSIGGGAGGGGCTDRRPMLLEHDQWREQYGVGLAGSYTASFEGPSE